MLSPVNPPSMSSNLGSDADTLSNSWGCSLAALERGKEKGTLWQIFQRFTLWGTQIFYLSEIIMHIKGSGILRFTNTKPQDVLICVITITIPGLFLDVGFSCFKNVCISLGWCATVVWASSHAPKSCSWFLVYSHWVIIFILLHSLYHGGWPILIFITLFTVDE